MKSDKKKELIIIAVVTVLMTAAMAVSNLTGTAITESDLTRPDVNGVEKILPLNVSEENGVAFDTDVAIQPVQYGEDNIENAFDEAFKVMDVAMLGDNTSADNITSKLNLAASVEGYPFEVQWISGGYDVIAYDGTINNLDIAEGEQVTETLTCTMRYEGWIRQKDYVLTVKSPDLTDEKVRESLIKKELEDAVSSAPDNASVALPAKVAGRSITYKKNPDWSSVYMMPLLGLAAAFAIYAGEKSKLRDKEKKRTSELKRDYSEMIHKLALLMGAGMTVRMAWGHIVNEYRVRLDSGRVSKKYVYEEMTETYYQLNSGVSEINAYGQFGSRCNTKEYLKFSSLIVQNLKKGSRELVNLLELEAIDAFEERKNMARKYGEEAGTKMLFPMVVMLVVVMGIIMVPAIMSFAM